MVTGGGQFCYSPPSSVVIVVVTVHEGPAWRASRASLRLFFDETAVVYTVTTGLPIRVS